MASISAEQARTIIRSALKYARANDFMPMGVAVVDDGGHLIAFEREDNTRPGSFDFAISKAKGAAHFGLSGKSLAGLSENMPTLSLSVAMLRPGEVFLCQGGVIVQDADGNLIGAVGATGDMADKDEACAIAGIEAAGLGFKA